MFKMIKKETLIVLGVMLALCIIGLIQGINIIFQLYVVPIVISLFMYNFLHKREKKFYGKFNLKFGLDVICFICFFTGIVLYIVGYKGLNFFEIITHSYILGVIAIYYSYVKDKYGSKK